MTTERMHQTMGAIADEAERAQNTYGDFASMHEAYGVLAEEVAELFDAVRMKQSRTGVKRAEAIRLEAIQVAAVALRIADQAERVTR
jgi:NTP pyrophosphatase (non-canonical NTP hydrolase)